MATVLRRFLVSIAAMVTALAGVLLTPLPASSGQPAAPAGAATRIAEAPDPGVSIGRITLSRGSVAASGVATVPVTVTAAVKVTGPDPLNTLELAFERDRPAPRGASRALLVPLQRISGTPAEGLWQGIAHVGSVHDGTLTATTAYLNPCWTCGADVISLKFDGPSITVRGSHIPRIRILPTPNPIKLSARSATLRATVIDTDTGRPYAKPVTVWFDYDNICVESEASVPRVTRGGVALRTLDTRRDKSMLIGLHCGYLYGPKDAAGRKVPLVADGTFYEVSSTVSIRPAARTVRANRPLKVRGTIADASSIDYLQVNVQRLVGRSQWRTLTVAVASKGRYEATIRYPTRGRLTLRTVVDGQLRATSPRAVVTVR